VLGSTEMANKMVVALNDFKGNMDEFSEFVSNHLLGAQAAPKLKEMAETIQQMVQRISPDHAKRIESGSDSLKDWAEAAAKESATGFATLYSAATVRLWTALEACVHDVCLARLEEGEYWRRCEAVHELKVPLGEYLSWEEAERIPNLYELVLSATKARLMPGVSRFEKILDAVDLGGAVHQVVERKLLALAACRNVMVHRHGIADRRLVELCPWLGLKPGNRVVVTQDGWFAFLSACTAYTCIVGLRMEENGLDVVRPERKEKLDEVLGELGRESPTAQ
jgi:hypothetical protein